MLENTWYSVISPESCSSILWRSWDYKEQAAEALKLTATDMHKNKMVDDIIKEPLGGAHVDPFLPVDYESITRNGGLRPLRINSAGDPYPDSTDPVPSALRTICTEIVMSVERSW